MADAVIEFEAGGWYAKYQYHHEICVILSLHIYNIVQNFQLHLLYLLEKLQIPKVECGWKNAR